MDLRERFERKYYIHPKDLNMANLLLRQICRPDPQYPESLVNSLYFDTADLEDYSRSEEGYFERRKIRVRWYGNHNKEKDSVSIFVELKTKKGFFSSKQRRQLSVSVSHLKPSHLEKGIIRKSELIKILAEFGLFPELPLIPIIAISYRRYRFIEMMTGIRVSLDSNIHSSIVAQELGHGESNLSLHGGVIEIKGLNLEIPATLGCINLLHTEWSRFSKYTSCVEAHILSPGSVSRLWPSGMMVI